MTEKVRTMNDFFPVSTPEEQGVPSRALRETIEFWNSRGLPVHSFLAVRRGHLVCEAYWAPWSAGALHRMFSVTKSFVSLAVGALCAQGKLSLDDRIVTFFPEKIPAAGPSPELAAVTVRDMLRMASCHARTAYKKQPGRDWVGAFFTAPPDHMPGMCFCYDTSATHTLCALVEKLSGRSLLDFLRGVCLDEIGFSSACYCLKDPCGVTQGGSGLMATSRDLMRVLALVAAQGRFNGRQLLPAEYLRQAVSLRISTAANPMGGSFEQRHGYGFQFWRTSRGWAMFGMGGQLAVCVPDEELLVVTTADTQGVEGGVQLLYDGLWEKLVPALSDAPLAPDESEAAALRSCIASLHTASVPAAAPQKTGCSGWYAFAPGAPWRALRLTVRPDEGELEFEGEDGVLRFPFGVGRAVRAPFASDPCAPCDASGAWLADGSFFVHIDLPGERLGNVTAQIAFRGECAEVLLHCHEELGCPGWEGTASAWRRKGESESWTQL